MSSYSTSQQFYHVLPAAVQHSRLDNMNDLGPRFARILIDLLYESATRLRVLGT